MYDVFHFTHIVSALNVGRPLRNPVENLSPLFFENFDSTTSFGVAIGLGRVPQIEVCLTHCGRYPASEIGHLLAHPIERIAWRCHYCAVLLM